jgi:hypothetical protein
VDENRFLAYTSLKVLRGTQEHHPNPKAKEVSNETKSTMLLALLANIGFVVGVLAGFIALLRGLLGLERELEERRKRRRQHTE